MTEPKYRVVFPSYDWDDAWLVNQIVNEPQIAGREQIGFTKGVPQEEGLTSDPAIRSWIDKNMEGCSCFILFVGEKTHLSRWVKYEMEQANKRGMARFIVHLEGMKRSHKDEPCKRGADPYQYHGMYSSHGQGYVIRQYSWLKDNGPRNIGNWIEEACSRTTKYR